MSRTPSGQLGYVLTSEDGRYWWTTQGGFHRLGQSSPLILPTCQAARDYARSLYARLGITAYPERLSLAT